MHSRGAKGYHDKEDLPRATDTNNNSASASKGQGVPVDDGADSAARALRPPRSAAACAQYILLRVKVRDQAQGGGVVPVGRGCVAGWCSSAGALAILAAGANLLAGELAGRLLGWFPPRPLVAR
ncbi:unnamed protein product [Amoebophrya sp. A120]|nr:unnamed protein product [Amoebophrya sp. A120]|eukprot:GSA120T00018725001.1